MRIVVDATSLARTITGIENYTKNLVINLIKLDKGNHEVFFLFRNGIPTYLVGEIEQSKIFVSPFKSQLLTEQIWIPYISKKINPDLIHFPAFPPSLFLKRKFIFTIFDATMWKHKETLSLKNRLYMKPLSSRAIRNANKLITISDSSKEEIIDVFPEISNKIKNLGISISKEFKMIDEPGRLSYVKEKFNLSDKFFLAVGSLEPRKNLIFLIKAFAEFKKLNINEYKLVITGRSAWGSLEVSELIKKNNLQDEIILTGYLEDNDLHALYNLATFFVFPSIYEGFGLPVLEAMACGTPVIISNSSSLPEVAGDAGIYIDPYDQDSLVAALNKVVNNHELYEDLKLKGLRRAKLFSWEKVAGDIFNEYIK